MAFKKSNKSAARNINRGAKPERVARRRNGKSSANQHQYLYGWHSVEAVLERAPEQVISVFLQKGRDDERVQAVMLLAKHAGVSVQLADKETLSEWSEGGNHQGVVAQFKGGSWWHESDLDGLIAQSDMPLVLVLDGVTDPHNLGACLRSANGAGVSVVIVPKDKSASLTPVVRKVACGAAELTPFIEVTNIARTLELLKQQGLWVVGLADEHDAELYESNLKQPLALVMGAEGKGMRRLTRTHCDEILAIPMRGNVSSLNVSVATAVCIYEALRQRTQS